MKINNLIKKKFITIFTLLFLIPILAIIGEFYFPYNITLEMRDNWNWLQVLFDSVYRKTFYISPFTTVIQFIYFVILMMISIRLKNNKIIVMSILFILLSSFFIFFSFARLLAAALVGP